MSANSVHLLASTAIVVLIALITPCSAQYNDVRCKCICPSPNVVTNINGTAAKAASDKNPERSVYIGNVHPHECNCDGLVLPQLTSDVQGKAKEFCPRCECKYESRNTTTIRWVVTLVIGVIICLIIYMGFLMLLDPLLHKGRRSQYEEQVNDEQELADHAAGLDERTSRSDSTVTMTSPSGSFSGSTQKNVLNRAVQQQTKWKKQVQEQRKNIYDKHTMLN